MARGRGSQRTKLPKFYGSGRTLGRFTEGVKPHPKGPINFFFSQGCAGGGGLPLTCQGRAGRPRALYIPFRRVYTGPQYPAVLTSTRPPLKIIFFFGHIIFKLVNYDKSQVGIMGGPGSPGPPPAHPGRGN